MPVTWKFKQSWRGFADKKEPPTYATKLDLESIHLRLLKLLLHVPSILNLVTPCSANSLPPCFICTGCSILHSIVKLQPHYQLLTTNHDTHGTPLTSSMSHSSSDSFWSAISYPRYSTKRSTGRGYWKPRGANQEQLQSGTPDSSILPHQCREVSHLAASAR